MSASPYCTLPPRWSWWNQNDVHLCCIVVVPLRCIWYDMKWYDIIWIMWSMWYESYDLPHLLMEKTEIHQQSKGCKVSSRSPWHLKTSRNLIQNNEKFNGKGDEKKQPKNRDYGHDEKKSPEICCFASFCWNMLKRSVFLEGLFLRVFVSKLARETTQGTRKRAPLDQSLGQPYQHQLMEIQKTMSESKISWEAQKQVYCGMINSLFNWWAAIEVALNHLNSAEKTELPAMGWKTSDVKYRSDVQTQQPLDFVDSCFTPKIKSDTWSLVRVLLRKD